MIASDTRNHEAMGTRSDTTPIFGLHPSLSYRIFFEAIRDEWYRPRELKQTPKLPLVHSHIAADVCVVFCINGTGPCSDSFGHLIDGAYHWNLVIPFHNVLLIDT